MVKRLYLDANGSTPAINEAREKILSSIDLIGNPSSFHDHGRILRAKIDEARFYVAQAANVLETETIFTSGASESNRLFVDALIEKARAKKRKLRLKMSPFEHPSLLKPIMKASRLGFFDLSIIEVDPSCGLINPFVDDCDVLILCAAHNETGIIFDLKDLLELPENIIVMRDISQTCSRLSSNEDRADVLTFSAQKMGGYAGAGAFVFRGNAKSLLPPWMGGGQERGFRPGTESVLSLLAFGAAAKFIKRERTANQKLKPLRDFFEAELKRHVNIKVIGETLTRLPNTSAITFLDEEPDALRIACDLAGLSVGFGAACSGLAPEGSFALKKLGLSTMEERQSVRFSLPTTITNFDISETLNRLKNQVLRAISPSNDLKVKYSG